jgi:Fe-S cluster assembly protein SufD
MLTQSLDQFAVEYENAARARGAEPPWLTTARRHALERFQSLGFPTTRDEEWRFTSVAPIAEMAFSIPGETADTATLDLGGVAWPGPVASELVFVNGHHVPALSRHGALPDGARVESLASSLTEHRGIDSHLSTPTPFERHPFVALNTAFLDEGAYIELPSGVVLKQPIHLIFLTAPTVPPAMTHPRVVVIMGDSSSASLVETYAGVAGAPYFTNAFTHVVLGENASLTHDRVQDESGEAFHVGAVHVGARRSASYTSHSISLGGRLVRNDLVASLMGEGVDCTLNGLYCADSQRLVDNHTTIDHAQPHCASRELYKGILADRAHGVFNGKIIVRPDAQKTDAKQTNRALLLSEDARINTKPQLEIFANDVKCTHGAAVGQLDEEALFYLRSRGVGDAAARHLLIRAFAADVLDRLPSAAVRARVEARLERQLARVMPFAA